MTDFNRTGGLLTDRYHRAAPVFSDADHEADIIGYALTRRGATRHYRRFYGCAGFEPPVGAVKACPERRGQGPVDGWEPVFSGGGER